jgi:hypothetical protein
MTVLLEVKPLAQYRLWLRYADGVEGIVDVSAFVGKGVFQLWEDYREFERVRVGPSGELAWGDERDLCPDAMYLRLTGKSAEEIFPALRELAQHA